MSREPAVDGQPHPPAYWRSLAEYHGTHDPGGEFPDGADDRPSGYSRRDFVRLLGASAALAGLQGCERPVGRVLPYVRRPPEVVPGTPLEYATTMTLDGYGIGLLAQSREGRPVKVEGNPDHPASVGGTGVFEQASVLQLYDPHRGRLIREGGQGRSWGTLQRLLAGRSGGPMPPSESPFTGTGEGLRILMEPTASPFRIRWIRAVRTRLPGARFHFFSPTASETDLEGTRRVFGQPLVPRYDFSRARVVVSLDADFLDQGPFRLRHAADFAEARRIRGPMDDMNRLYAAEPMVSATGAVADHRLPIRAGRIGALAAALAELLDDSGAGLPYLAPRARAWARFAARDLLRHRGRAVVLAGPSQPAGVHALVALINHRIGATGAVLSYGEPQLFEAGEASHDLAPLVRDMAAGRVEQLLVLDANPVYSAPADLEFAAALERVPWTLCSAMYANETARTCRWHVPSTHYLESWGDARAFDGTVSLVQPLIRPLYEAHSVDEVLAALAGRGMDPAHQLLEETWARDLYPRYGEDRDFETFWRESLRRGTVPGSGGDAVDAAPDTNLRAPLIRELRRGATDGLEAVIKPDPRVHDGRFANNAWLLELPDPVTKLTWENAALLAPATAERLGIETGEVIRVSSGDRSIEIPAMSVPGHARDAVTLRLGYGREGAEETASGAGVSAYRLRTTDAPSLLRDVHLDRLWAEPDSEDGDREPRRVALATTQTHWSMEGRDIVLERTLDEYREHPDFTEHHRGPVPTLYEGPGLNGERQWGMTIDLALCTGCSACVTACQAENNIPVVGKQGVLDSREMHWIRVDRYQTGDPERPDVVHQPMLCQHCEKAPCEYVCPVNATVHSDDGLNEMIYQRCVGTRFCSNNCAWKVRRFNWFDYNAGREAPETLVLNPDVTVRERGVMEKCSYCVQRIRRAERTAELEDRPLRAGEVTTACEQACPTNAIVFGNLNDPDSPVARTRDRHRIYSVLHELGTLPRTQYLARITNPDGELRALETTGGEGEA